MVRLLLMKNFWPDLPKPFFALAPMEGVTDIVFRQVVARAARPDTFFTEFTNAASYNSPEGKQSTDARLANTADEQPIVAQIWGTDPEQFATMAKDLAAMGFAGIDINMGCPVKDVIKSGACSALIENPALAAELIAATKEGGLPVSVKTRIGFKTKKTEEWLGFLLQQNIAALSVHGRTQKEMSKVPADWHEITKATTLRNSLAPQTLIIGNGDVQTRTEGLQKAKESGVDGVMIGRGVFHNVFCFEAEVREHTLQEYVDLLNYHLDLYDQTWAKTSRAYAPLKRFFKIYIKGFPGAGDIREYLMNTKSTDEAREVIATYCHF